LPRGIAGDLRRLAVPRVRSSGEVMSDSYTKLFSSITASTIVSEPLATRWLWVTMLAMADGNGDVHGSVPGLARIANITLAECETALACFLNPDAYSRTKDNDGRRIADIDGGWKLLNHAKYRRIRSAEERREYMREYMRNRRAQDAESKEPSKPERKLRLAESTEVTPPAPSPTPDKAIAQHAARFEDFWAAYPVKKGRAKAEAKWKSAKLDAIADRIIADVKRRLAEDRQWRDGYIPHGSTYVNGRGWEDAIEPAKAALAPRDDIPDFMRGMI
jgi:hypothetical protein